MSYDLKTIRAEFKKAGVFHTPKELAELLKAYANPNPVRVYDPTCGSGNLLSVFGDDVEKYGQEIDGNQLRSAEQVLKNFTGYEGDTLKNPAFLGMKFDCIVANPPFSVAWEPVVDERFADAPTIPTKSRADFAFILHVLHYLSDDGVASVLSAPGVLFRGGRELAIRRWMVERGYIEKVIHIPGNTFVDTTMATALLVLRKNRSESVIEFIDSDTGKSYVADVPEIERNEFALSPSRYLPEDQKEKPASDPVALEFESRAEMIERLRADIRISQMVCEVFGHGDFDAYLDDIESVVREFRAEHHNRA